MKTAWALGLLLATAACGDSLPTGAKPQPASILEQPVLEQAVDHFSECVADEATGTQMCTSCHAGGDAGPTMAKVLVEGAYVDLCLPGLM